MYLLSTHTHSTYWVLARLLGLGMQTVQSVKDPAIATAIYKALS